MKAFYFADFNGNVVSLVATNSQRSASYLYDPYGNLIASWGPLADANTYRFSSKELHSRSGLIHFGVRYYSPALQRWINADPIQEDGGINLYAYVGNSPVVRSDPLGASVGSFIKRVWKGIVQGFNKAQQGAKPGWYYAHPGSIMSHPSLYDGPGVSNSDRNALETEAQTRWAEEELEKILAKALPADPKNPKPKVDVVVDKNGRIHIYVLEPATNKRTGPPTVHPLRILTQDVLNTEYQGVWDRLQDGPEKEDVFDIPTFFTGKDVEAWWMYEGKLYRGNEVNYLGIGMYDAWKGYSWEASQNQTAFWKKIWYGEKKPSASVVFWLGKGYWQYHKMFHERYPTSGSVLNAIPRMLIPE